MFDLINVFEVFLPQLLRYPNPSDPLNGEAAAMLIRDPAGFDLKVREYVKRFCMADKTAAGGGNSKQDGTKDAQAHGESSADDSEVSSIAAYSDDANGLEL